MLTCLTKRRKNSLISFDRTRHFRDDLLLFSKRSGGVVFLTEFNNPYFTYEATTFPMVNGTHKVKVKSVDNLENENTGTEGQVVIDYFPLPPVNLSYSVSGNNVALTWSHPTDGAPTNYYIFGNGGLGNLDKSFPLHIISGSLTTYTFAVTNGVWKFVVDSYKNGKRSDSYMLITVYVPSSSYIPPKSGPSGAGLLDKTGLSLSRVSVGRVKIDFLWLHGTNASRFNIYHDDATGVISYVAPKYSFSRIESLFQTYTTGQLHVTDDEKTYKFVVRAETTDGVEEENTDEYSISIDGKAPDEIVDLDLGSTF